MPRSGKRARHEGLSAGRIEAAALALIERDGFDGFSTRKLAAELGCEAMSIYHYFPSKQHLLDALVDRVLATMPAVPEHLAPMEKMRRLALDNRAMALRFPRFYQYLAYHRLNTPGGIAFIDRILRAISELDLDLETTARVFRAIGYYLTGAALDETTGYAKGHSAATPVSDEAIARDHPLVLAVNPYFKQAHHEKTFLVGLDMVLEGVQRYRREAEPRRRPKRVAATARKRAPRPARS
jgi:AcrR family transcriptional regulator